MLLHSFDADDWMEFNTALRSSGLPVIEVVKPNTAHFERFAYHRGEGSAADDGVEGIARLMRLTVAVIAP